MGGNKLVEVPTSLGELKYLQALVLSDNLLESLPANIANLHQLKSLLLHKNRLRTLPPEIVALKNLSEVIYMLSLRINFQFIKIYVFINIKYQYYTILFKIFMSNNICFYCVQDNGK